MFKKYPFMKQQATKECAAASVWMIVKYYKGHVSMNKLCYMLRITKNGTTAYHIIETLNCLGFNAKGLRLKKIDSIKTPFIAHVIINKTYKHFIVVYEINKDFLLIADPARGIKKVSYDDFYSMWTGVVITMYPVRLLIKEKEISPVVFCINFVKKYRYMLIKIGLLSLIITVLSVFSAFFFQTLIDYMEDIVNVSFFFILIIFINIVITYYRNRLLIIFSNKIGKDLLNKFFKQILSLPYLYYSRYTTGEVMSRFNDLYLLQNFFSKSLVIIFLDLPLCLFSGIVLFSLNKILFMIVLFTLIFYIFVITVFHHKNLAFINDYQDKKALVNSYMTECVSGINTIKGLNAEKRVYQKFYFKHQVFLETDLRANFLANLISCLKDFIGSFGYVLSLIIGIILVQKGTLPLSYLITYVFLTNFFLNPIRSLFDLDFEFKESLNALRRILELTIDKKELKEKFVGDICFEKVSYSFNNINYVLKDIDLVIKAGNKVLITGSSGSGKSTLLKMIKGYYKSNVRIGDKVVTNPLNVVLISSSDLLFTDTIYNNLTLNNSKDINKIIDICCIDEIIKRFDLGYNTLLEENGFNLSAGQRQRIILGRSLSNADILLIDEATNSLNSNLERRILKKLFLYYKNKTIIVVSHRLDNLDLFDQYIKLSKGKVTLNETYNMGVKNV